MKRTITYKSLEMEIDYFYYPAERCIRYDSNLDGYPGYPSTVLINNVFHAKENINKFIDEMDWWDTLEELIIEIEADEDNNN